jgi:DNA-binding MarR family transcriptional regulator
MGIPFDNEVVEIVHQVVESVILPEMSRPGYQLPFLLIGAFRAVVDDLHAELAERGHPGARPLHGFALQAVGPDGATLSELGRRLGVSKQAAGKTAGVLTRLGYVERAPDPTDARAVRLRRTARGEELLALSAAGFERIRSGWAAELGAERMRRLEDDLERLGGTSAKLGDLPGWLR